MDEIHHRRTAVPPCVNGDIAIQWEWSNFDPSQKSSPLTDYDKTLYNWLRPRNEQVTQNLCQSAVRERLAKYVKYKASSFLFLFFPDSPTEVTPGWILTHDSSKHDLWCKEMPFWGAHHGRQHFEVQIFPKTSKMAFYKHVLASANGLKTNDVIDDWRLTSLACSVARSPSLVGQRILYIASWESLRLCIFQRSSTVFCMEIQFWQVYTAFVCNLLYRVSHKMIPCAVLFESFKNFETLIRKQRTLGEPFDLALT